MKKIVVSLILVLTLTLSPVFAASITFVTDNLDYLTEEQTNDIETKAQEVYNQYGIEIYCVTDDYTSLLETSQSKGQGSITLQVDEDQDCHVLVDGIIAQRFGDDDIKSLEEAFIEKTGVYEKILNFISEAKWTLDWYDIRVEHNLITTAPVTTSPDMVIAPNPETLNTNFVIDEAGLLTESQRQGLQSTLAEIDKRLDVNVVVVTVNSTGDKTAEAYADDYYDYHNFKSDGILLLINMGQREYHFSTAGFGIEAINDDGLTLLENKIVPYLSNGNYAGAFGEFASQCDSLFTQARNGDPYVEPTPVKERTSLISVLTGTAPISAILGFLMAKLKVGGLKNQLKTVKGRYEANSYVRNQSLNLTENRDIFLYNVITKTPRPKQQPRSNGPGGGHSTTHMSSSGSMHGGRGGRF